VAQGAVIDSASFFGGIPHTFFSFELDGLGVPVTLLNGQSRAMPGGEYSTMGLVFNPPVRWVNDATPAFDAAQTIGASPTNAIPSSLVNTFDITFTLPVVSVGVFVVNNRLADPAGPWFEAFDAQGILLESVQLSGSLIDGTVTTPNVTADYGFMGIFATRPIARITVHKQAAILDDLYISPVPSPGGAAFLGVLLLSRHRARAGCPGRSDRR